MQKYRMIGTTDDVIDCAKCGKLDLRMTVVLELLDAEGNSEGVTYFGSTCAAKVLAERGVRTTAAKVRDEAERAQAERWRAAKHAQERLDYYGLPAVGNADSTTWIAAVERFAEGNAIALRNNPSMVPAIALGDLVTGWQAAVAAVKP